MALLSQLDLKELVKLATLLLTSSFVSVLFYRVFFHPLRSVPGPLITKCTSLWLYYQSWAGDEATQIGKLHERYGPVVRIAPNEVDISDGEALAPVYSIKGGFMKADHYLNFDIHEHHTIFSATDPEHRRSRAKAVMPMFSTAAIYAKAAPFQQLVRKCAGRMRQEAKSRKPVNILNLTRSIAADAVSSFLFSRKYGAIDEEDIEEMSASQFVNAFVGVGRYFYLPKRAFLFLESAVEKLQPSGKVIRSIATVESFVQSLVDDADEKEDTYEARLLRAGFSRDEAVIQCEDLMFAGIDSTGQSLSTTLWYLAGNPLVYRRLSEELQENFETSDPEASLQRLQSLPYLKAVAHEGLRLALPNPTRLPRVVPPGGWQFQDRHLPAGTVVGVGSWQLHLNEKVFEDPLKFNPDRWIEPSASMQRDFVPFGIGLRSCIAKNMAMTTLLISLDVIVRSGALEGARRIGDKIETYQWFNARVKGERIELIWQ